MADERRNKIKKVFDSNKFILRTAVLRGNYVCSRDILELFGCSGNCSKGVARFAVRGRL